MKVLLSLFLFLPLMGLGQNIIYDNVIMQNKKVIADTMVSITVPQDALGWSIKVAWGASDTTGVLRIKEFLSGWTSYGDTTYYALLTKGAGTRLFKDSWISTRKLGIYIDLQSGKTSKFTITYHFNQR